MLAAAQGVAVSDDPAHQAQRAAFAATAAELTHTVLRALPLDGAVDQLAAAFLRKRLPPPAAVLGQPPALQLATLAIPALLWACDCQPRHTTLSGPFA
jgi:hypothetical protein